MYAPKKKWRVCGLPSRLASTENYARIKIETAGRWAKEMTKLDPGPEGRGHDGQVGWIDKKREEGRRDQ